MPAARPSGGASGRPNILLVILDTVRADRWSLYGYHRPTTPQMDQFARQATTYTRATATGDMTLTTHASLFTGLYPSWHGAYHIDGHVYARKLDSSLETIAEMLANKGYSTQAVLANSSYLLPNFGLHQGFQYYDVRSPVTIAGRPNGRIYLRHPMRKLLSHMPSTVELDRNYRRGDEITAGALARIESSSREDRPFFLVLNYMDAHAPYIPPSPFDRLGFSPYDGAIAYLDSQLARLFSRLRELNLFDDMLILVTADHGEGFSEHGLMRHSVSTYQELIHIPLVVKYPRQRDGQVVNALVSQVDVMPTILEVVGEPAPSHLQGRSLRHPETAGPRMVFSESFEGVSVIKNNRITRRIERAITRGTMKFITSTLGKRELYDLARDPGETQNLFRPGDPVALDLQSKLNTWMSLAPAAGAGAKKPDPHTIERLRSLGYVQ